MSDLISKKDAVNVAKGFVFTDETQKRQYMDFLHYCLDNTPIAYDLDEVINELEEKSKYYMQKSKQAKERGLIIYIQEFIDKSCLYDDAIKIVKRGVSNENN